MPFDPEPLRLRSTHEAWQSALGELQLEMPKASFDTWVRDTQLVSCEDGSFTIGVRNAYAREWLESRLTSTVTRLLMGIMNRDVQVSFVVNSYVTANDDDNDHHHHHHHHNDDDDDDDDEGNYRDDSNNEPETTEVQVIHRLRYDEVVMPGRVVALPGYFSRLIPEIGARNAWLYVGWRQAVWDGQRQDGGSRTKRVPVRQIIHFSGLSRRTFFRAVEEQSTWEALAGLVARNDAEPRWSQGRDKRAHRLPNRYTVHMTLPLVRADASAVQEWLAGRMQAGFSLLNALHEATRIPDLVGELLPPTGLPPPALPSPSPRPLWTLPVDSEGLKATCPLTYKRLRKRCIKESSPVSGPSS